MPPNSWRAAPPWCWPVTTTSCRHRRTSIRLDRWIITRCSNPKAAKPLRVCWLKAGPTRSGGYIRTGRSGHSGITNMIGGRRTKACDSITFALDEGVGPARGRWCRPMGAWAGKRPRPCANMDNARSLDQSCVNHEFIENKPLETRGAGVGV